MEVQQEVLSCLCNLSLSGCISAEHSQFIAAVDVRSLIILCSEYNYRLFGAITLEIWPQRKSITRKLLEKVPLSH